MSSLEGIHHHHQGEDGSAVDGQHASTLEADGSGRIEYVRLGGKTGQVAFDPLPGSACWQHQGLRSGFEVAYFTTVSSGIQIEGTTTGLQEGETWVASYRLEVDGDSWRTRSAVIDIRTSSASYELALESVGDGRWLIDGHPAKHLDGCLDVDLESSAVTNALPVHRLELAIGASSAAPAAYVRIDGGQVERLEQTYARMPDRGEGQCYDYAAPTFDFGCRLVYDGAGLVVDYPGIARRAR